MTMSPFVNEKIIEFCGNCKTERYGIFCRGYCYRCYPLIVRKEEVERWDLKIPSTLKRLPSICADYSQRALEEEFPKIKAKRLKELEFRLWLFKTQEARRNGEVTGLDIEHGLCRVAKWCGGKEAAVQGIASTVNSHFEPEARRALLGWLFNIEESMRWDPRRYWHALHPEEVERMMAQNRVESKFKPHDFA
jgi:hypothetical protein